MKNKLIFALAVLGILAGLIAAYILGQEHHPAPPLFAPTPNPYSAGIYANGIIESRQANGQNVNLYPEVAGTVSKILVKEGDQVRAGQPMLELDDSIQRATTEQIKLQADAASSALNALRAQPRKEQLDVMQAQLEQARANQRTVEDQYRKLAKAHDADAGTVSQDALDTAANQLKSAQAAVTLAQRQFDLSKAGAWAYDIQTQERQSHALAQAYQAAHAVLSKYVVRAPINGVVMAVNAGVGSYISSLGVYSTYTGSQAPIAVMSDTQDEFAVRCYVDEILIQRLPSPDKMHAQLSVRGTDLKVPLVFDRIQPYVTPKLQLSDQRQERVDLRVLPVIFHFKPPANSRLYPGQLVDVYIGQGGTALPPANAPSSSR